MIDIDLEKDKDFNRSFWIWFDNLDGNDKKRFWYYQLDMSKLFFYNKYYRFERKNEKNNSNCVFINT